MNFRANPRNQLYGRLAMNGEFMVWFHTGQKIPAMEMLLYLHGCHHITIGSWRTLLHGQAPVQLVTRIGAKVHGGVFFCLR